jgi:hypothetical protein
MSLSEDIHRMWLLAPDILELTRQLSPLVCILGLLLGGLLWSIGGSTYRFWLALLITIAAGGVGLNLGRPNGVQPLVAGLLMALAAGVMALALARITLFVAGGLAGVLLARAAGWNELIGFLVGGLAGVCLYRLWITALSSLAGTLLMLYSLVSGLDRMGWLNSMAWAEHNGPLINWGVAGGTLVGMLAQNLLERWRERRGAMKADAMKKAAAPPAPPPPPPPLPWWKVLLQKAA